MNVKNIDKNNVSRAEKEALKYHSIPRPGKIEIEPTKATETPEDLSLAYSPGVAFPSMEINRDPDKAYEYTNRGNLVGVISNGTAVLGLGDIGAESSKPVMEGKALLFKIFAGLDSYDIEIKEKDPKKLAEEVIALSPTFGGINLEDIKAPECFEVEKLCIEGCDIPVMHDDQHGTAVVSGAALLNAIKLTGKDISQCRMVINGAGAAAISCAKIYKALGIRKENLIMCDSKGPITTRRSGLSPQKQEFATESDVTTLAEAVKGADIFVGLSVADSLKPEMLASMAPRPIVFALANPNPEISREKAFATRDDLIFATGRSDYPNQINNVLAFPYIFRGAIDSRSSRINEEMKLAAAKAIARLAHLPVSEGVKRLYKVEDMSFGRDYILPKPFDKRLLTHVAPAVAEAARESGVAKEPIKDMAGYAKSLSHLVGDNDRYIEQLLQNELAARK